MTPLYACSLSFGKIKGIFWFDSWPHFTSIHITFPHCCIILCPSPFPTLFLYRVGFACRRKTWTNLATHSFSYFFKKYWRPWIRMGRGNLCIPFIFHWVILKMTTRKSDTYYCHLTTYSLNYFAGLGTRKNWLKTDQSGAALSVRVMSQQMKSVRREPRKESKLNV